MEFQFREFNPDTADSALIEQVGLFLKSEVWGATAPSMRELDFYRSYHLAVALDETGKLAAAGAMLGYSTEYYIADMATAPEYRRTFNLGSTILGMLERKAKDNGAEYMRGWSLSGAVGFYLRHGYQLADPADSSNTDIYKELSPDNTI